ncbi:hypothetical protein, partial [Escherichia coli]|uniref:hypothetical protein n=3 Tax=Escherichia coli TaxID=562 RepID=UPI00197C638D
SLRQKQKKLIMLPSETMIWQPEFTDKTLSRKTGAVHIDYTYAIEVKNSVSFGEWIRHNAGHRFLSLVSDERKRANLVNKSGAICKFLSCVTATQPSMPPVIPFVL